MKLPCSSMQVFSQGLKANHALEIPEKDTLFMNFVFSVKLCLEFREIKFEQSYVHALYMYCTC